MEQHARAGKECVRNGLARSARRQPRFPCPASRGDADVNTAAGRCANVGDERSGRKTAQWLPSRILMSLTLKPELLDRLLNRRHVPLVRAVDQDVAGGLTMRYDDRL
jgi:hypothetical protein